MQAAAGDRLGVPATSDAADTLDRPTSPGHAVVKYALVGVCPALSTISAESGQAFGMFGGNALIDNPAAVLWNPIFDPAKASLKRSGDSKCGRTQYVTASRTPM
jgi:hypothetical protein